MRLATIFTLAVLATSSQTWADTVAYESFNYSGQTFLEGQNGGFGWDSPWESTFGGQLQIQSSGLNWSDDPGNLLPTIGGAVFMAGSPQGLLIERSWDTTNVYNDGAETWVSFLVDSDQTQAALLAPFSLGNTGGGGDSSVGFQAFGAMRLRINNVNGFSADSSGVQIDDGQTHMVVGRFRFFDNADDEFTMWVDPPLDSPPADADGIFLTANLNLDPESFDKMLVKFPNNATNHVRFDEIRIGTDYISVAPIAVLDQASDFNVIRGFQIAGGLAEVAASDNEYLTVRRGLTLFSSEPPVWLEFTGLLSNENPAELEFIVEANATTANLNQKIELFDYVAGAYVEVDSGAASTDDFTVTVVINGDAARYVQTGTGETKARVSWKPIGIVAVSLWSVGIDQIGWVVD